MRFFKMLYFLQFCSFSIIYDYIAHYRNKLHKNNLRYIAKEKERKREIR